MGIFENFRKNLVSQLWDRLLTESLLGGSRSSLHPRIPDEMGLPYCVHTQGKASLLFAMPSANIRVGCFRHRINTHLHSHCGWTASSSIRLLKALFYRIDILPSCIQFALATSHLSTNLATSCCSSRSLQYGYSHSFTTFQYLLRVE